MFDVVIDGEVIQIGNDDVGSIVVHRWDTGIELAKSPVGHEADHGAGLDTKKGRSERSEHRSHPAAEVWHSGYLAGIGESGEFFAQRFNEDTERLLILCRPGRTIRRVQFAGRR